MASQSGGGGGGGGGTTPSVSGYESPMVRQELAKLDKGGEKRRSAMACLRACVETLDPTTFPRFLSQVGDARDITNSRADTISLFLDIARVHGRAAVPEIPRMMAIITRSLASSGSSIHLHEVCAKAVSALLRYSISPFSAMADAAAIFPEICQPLLDVLSAKLEPLAAGAAACLQAAVESEKWKYAPAAVAAEVCSRSCTSLKERSGQTVGHIHLVRSLVRAGAVGTDSGVGLVRTAAEMLRANQAAAWQQRAAALQLIRALLTSLDKKSLAAESEAIGEIIEHIRRDRMPHVRSEAAKALQALKTAQLSSSLSEIDVKGGGGGGGTNKLEDGAAEVMRSCTGSAVRSASKRRFFRSAAAAAAAEEEVIVSQESQVISLCLVSPDSSSPMSRRGRRRYPPLSPAQRRGGSSNSSSICTSEDADAMDSFVRFEEPCLVNGIEGKKLDLALDESFLDDQCAASSESCVIDDSEEVTAAEFYGEGPATAKSTNGRYGLGGQSPASTISSADGDDDHDLAKFAVSDVATPERSGVILTAEDFTQYTTPRRLVRSLQALVSSPDSDLDETLQEDTVRNDAENEQEESGDAAWSVRDNPIADQDSFNDRHRHYNQQPLPQQQQQHGECDAPVFQDENEEQEQHGDFVKLSSPASSKKSIMLRKSSVKKKMAWKKTAREWIEVLLGGLLVVVLLMSVAMVVAMVVFDRQDVGLVPT